MASSSVVGFIVLFLYVLTATSPATSAKGKGNSEPSSGTTKLDILQKIEGKVQVANKASDEWIHETRICLNGGEYCAFPKESGDFVIHNVPPGSYLVEVYSSNFNFEPVRVDISSKNGKIRARKVNLLKAKEVVHITYPLKFKAESQSTFFEKRESWSLIATLKNPMVLLLVAPVILMLILPRLMKSMDPDTQKEMQESMSMMQQPGASLPSMEEFFTNLFGGGSTTKTTKKPMSKATKKKDKH